MGRTFVHLHVHTVYSLLDGHSRIEDLADKAAALGMPALAITDHGVMYGVVEFYKACKERGIKPIIGCEVYEARRTRFDRTPKVDEEPYHLTLLAENAEGYANLMKVVSSAHLDGFYYKPRVDLDLLREHKEGLIALSGCVAGSIPQAILGGDYEAALRRALVYREIFGRDNFFLEVQDNGLPEQKRVNRALVDISAETRIPLVATNDCHYTNREDARSHDVLLCIQTNRTINDRSRLRFGSDEFYLKSPEEMEDAFSFIPEALANAVGIAERVDLEFEFGRFHLPKFAVPEGFTESSYLRKLCEDRLTERYPNPSAEVRERLEYELGVIDRMGYPGYFLIVADFVNYARSKGIPVGPGRGSAAGSLVAYVLGITRVDPLRYGLLFERFLNPERVTLPDMDIDFCFERRGEVIDYVTRKYGQDCVAQIITFGTMAARAVIRDVGRALDMPYSEVDRIAKMVPAQLGITLDRAVEVAPELKRLAEGDPKVKELVHIARTLEGMPRHASVHAAGVVITGRPLTEFVPLQRAAEGGVVTQFTMDVLEELGLLKMDFLGLRTLTVLDHAVKEVRRTRGVDIDLDSIPLDDRPTYQMLSRGETLGVFQLESDWVRDFLRNLKPERFEDIIASVALCRPGPMEHIPEFVRSRSEGARYLHPRMEPILKETHGVMVYQEQIMQVASVMAGFTLAEADILRRAVGKKKKELLDKMRESFLAGCVRNGVDRETAKEVYELIMKFANYGFNKAHAAAYALVAYQTAYVKQHYPAEFMAALLTSVSGQAEKVAAYIEECRRLGLRVLPPDINESMSGFTVTADGVRFGLSAIKNVGASTVDAVIAARQEGGPYTSLADFCSRVDPRAVNRRVLESLIRSGAMSGLGRRTQLLAAMDDAIKGQGRGLRGGDGQISLLEPAALPRASDNLPDIPEFPLPEILKMEKEVLGLYISGHPLRDYERELRIFTTCNCAALAGLEDGARVRLGGVVSGLKRVLTKNGDAMGFVTLEDLSGTVEVVVFPKVYARCSENVRPDEAVLVAGRVQLQEDQPKVIAEEVYPLRPPGIVHVKVPVRSGDSSNGGGALAALKSVLGRNPGSWPVCVHLTDEHERTGGSKKVVLVDSRLWVNPSRRLVEEIEAAVGEGSVVVEQNGANHKEEFTKER